VPANTVAEFIALAKERPGKINLASAGVGTGTHISAEMFQMAADVSLFHVPYRGVQALAGTVAGQADVYFGVVASSLPQIKAGKLRALAVTGDKRSAAAPELPTVAEAAALPGYEVSVWYGVLAPAGTPPAVVSRLHAELVKIVQSPDIATRFAALGAEPLHNTPDQFAAFLRNDLVKWTKVVRDSGAKID
jgi:tripartite-type tricarboxylate transporter receptor subunit TctC